MRNRNRAFNWLSLGALVVWAANAQRQIPLFEGAEVGGSPANLASEEDWSFAAAPPANSTAQLVFSTVQNLLQHWPNTRYRNGHTIVPAIVPVGTLLYHGTYQGALPTVPEWTATDPEHSYLFCRAVAPDSGCWQATIVATRPLRVLYFDGSSAAKMLGGPMDSQDLVVWGEVRPEKTFDERGRIRELCAWGKEFGVDGFARMEMDFEIMLCDFTAGVETVSLLNLAPPEVGNERRDPPTPRPTPSASPSPPPPSRGSRPALVQQALDLLKDEPGPLPPPRRTNSTLRIAPMFRVIESGSWHNHFPGETRIKPDYTRLISFYDPLLFPSLVRARESQTRLEHRLEGLSKEDSEAFRGRLEEAVRVQDAGVHSGVDWATLLNTVTERFAERLELLVYILNTTDVASISEEEAAKRLRQAHRHVTSMVGFYVLRTSTPPKEHPSQHPADHTWAAPVLEHCATTHTRWLDTPRVVATLTASERLLLGAVKGVQKEICRVLVGIWAEGAELGMRGPEDSPPSRSARLSALSTPSKDLAKDWTLKTEGLMAWLDWSYWLQCRPACSYEEMCYLSTWPFFSDPTRRRSAPGMSKSVDWVRSVNTNDQGGNLDPGDGDWEDPKPKCIRRVEPLRLTFYD